LIITGEKKGEFAFQINARKLKKSTFWTKPLFNLIVRGYTPSDILTRKVLLEEKDYKSVLKKLSNTKISAPVYYIISGKNGNEGAVIERDPKKPNAVYELTEERWFLVQTNYDRDEPDPASDFRRIPAENKIKNIG